MKEFARGRSAAAWRPPRPPQQQSTIAAEAGAQEEEHLCTQNQNLLLMAGEQERAVQLRRFGGLGGVPAAHAALRPLLILSAALANTSQ